MAVSVKFPKIRLVRTILTVILFLAVSAVAIYFYFQYEQTKKLIPHEVASENSKKIIESVGKLIELPAGEEPTVATISDAEKLKNQPFFTRAKNGDKILIYTNAKKAILYDPVSNKIVDVAPVAIGTGSATISPAPTAQNTPTPKPTIKPPTPTEK